METADAQAVCRRPHRRPQARPRRRAAQSQGVGGLGPDGSRERGARRGQRHDVYSYAPARSFTQLATPHGFVSRRRQITRQQLCSDDSREAELPRMQELNPCD